MKKLMTIIGVFAIAFAATAGTIKLNTGPYSGIVSGGEFTATTSDLGTFQTFCIEKNEYFIPGLTYNYSISSGAKNGGLSGAINGIDNISIGTAWLYSQFRNGLIPGYGGLNHQTEATALQNAIWFLEGELGVNRPTGLTGTYLSLADSAIGGDITRNSDGAYDVVALNIVDKYGNRQQDQLAIYSVPDTGTSMCLAAMVFPFLLFGKSRMTKLTDK